MQIDWQSAINNILSKKLSCPRCGSLADDVLVGYLRLPDDPAERSVYGDLPSPHCRDHS